MERERAVKLGLLSLQFDSAVSHTVEHSLDDQSFSR